MVQEDFERLHKFLLETDGLSEVSDDMRQLAEHEWPELVDVEDYIVQMAAAHLDSKSFRSAPRTCRPFCSRLSVSWTEL
jgi:hypothetical protein